MHLANNFRYSIIIMNLRLVNDNKYLVTTLAIGIKIKVQSLMNIFNGNHYSAALFRSCARQDGSSITM
jgi:hypothetical protein